MHDTNDKLHALVAAFHDLEVDDPVAWAQSELDEGIPQLAIGTFLTLANAPIDRLEDPRAIRELLRGVGQKAAVEALGRLLSTNSVEDVLQVIRWSLRAYLVELSFLLDDTAATRFSGQSKSKLLEEMHWCLFRTNEAGLPDAPMGGLHEVISEFFRNKL